jgi:low affinity Fe/Cu permease
MNVAGRTANGESARPSFARFAQAASRLVGRPGGFIVAVLAVLVWAASGPFLGFSESWQLVINTGTTILTFLMVFLLQSTQNRDTEAIQLKLDELLRALEGARTSMVGLDQLSDEERERLREKFTALAERARAEEPDDPELGAPAPAGSAAAEGGR